MSKLSILVSVHGRTFTAKGRVAWALWELCRAGEKGVTPIDVPGPRWSGYVHVLRHEYGLDIETVTEKHGGPFPGSHARYVLRSPVQIVADDVKVAA
jgi:hypothetical protein